MRTGFKHGTVSAAAVAFVSFPGLVEHSRSSGASRSGEHILGGRFKQLQVGIRFLGSGMVGDSASN